MITKEEILEAQQTWGRELVQIGADLQSGADYKARAHAMISKLYGYDLGDVLFKPTRAAEIPFRLTFDGALSYFVGGNSDFPEDKGFALEPWKSVEFRNAGIITGKILGMAMGTYYLVDTKGNGAEVEYTFGYIRDGERDLRIQLHHSSMPFSG